MNDSLVSAQTQIAYLTWLGPKPAAQHFLLQFFFHFLQPHPHEAGRRSVFWIAWFTSFLQPAGIATDSFENRSSAYSRVQLVPKYISTVKLSRG